VHVHSVLAPNAYVSIQCVSRMMHILPIDIATLSHMQPALQQPFHPKQ